MFKCEECGKECETQGGQYSGMTLRDWFAGQALNGILSDSSQPKDRAIVRDAYYFADLMIEKRGDEG